MQCFVVQSDEIEGRLDVFYYQPEFVELEKRIKKLSPKILGDYIINISGGATPEKDKAENYYTNSSENGVPFLRVQNVTDSGLYLEDCKYINFDTHNGMLKRSHVREGYLVTKITGVGRMAVSSVVPEGFEGNINQHLVAIKTDSYKTSEVLAAFLNSDIGERLAFRRSTGGTRPALDYQALKTIPVVFKSEIVDIMQSAYTQKKQKKAEAQRLLDSIDGYVLDELGIKLSVLEEKKCFVISTEDIKGRIDPVFYKPIYLGLKEIAKKSKWPMQALTEISVKIVDGPFGSQLKVEEYVDSGIPLIRVKDIKNGKLLEDSLVFITPEKHEQLRRSKVYSGDILLTKAGSIGNAAVLPNHISEANITSHLAKIELKEGISAAYVCCFLNTSLGKLQIQRLGNKTTRPELNISEVSEIEVVYPPLEIQNKIAEEVKRRISEAERLKAEASKIVEEAKKEVEAMILGD